jgi:hypothetical protein
MPRCALPIAAVRWAWARLLRRNVRVTLIVLVLRMLLAQAVARDVEAAHMQAELDEVI